MGFSVHSKLTALLVAIITITSVVAVGSHSASAAFDPNCSTNSIMKCGAASPSVFISKTKANAPGDLPTIYADYGLVSSEYSKFVTSAREGVVHKSTGNIVVDGVVVGTSAHSIGRESKSFSTAKRIGGHTYYQSDVRDVLSRENMPIMVMFNSKGVMQFAVMNTCGNPMTFKPTTPTASCDLLQKTAVSGKKDTYSFLAKASAAGGATVAKVVYDFGDGTSVTMTNLTTPVVHTYATPGTFTAKVTVFVSLPGGSAITVVSAKCTTTTVVEQPKVPFQQCVSVTGIVLDKEQRNHEFTVTTSQGNGSTLKGASINFGDGVIASDLAPTTPTTVKTTHAFAKEGKFTVVATVDFNTVGGVQSVTCQTEIDTGTTPVCATNPSLPANSPECQPCEFNPQLPANSPDCKKPEVLVNTGPGSIIGLFTASSIAAGFGYRRFLMRRSL